MIVVLLYFIFYFINEFKIRAGSLDPRDVDWDHVIGDRRQPEVSAETNDDTSGTFLSGISLALFIPLLIVCIFLLVFGICFLRHSLSKRCRRIDGASFNSMFRGVATPYGGGSGDRSRNSTRSTNPLQVCLIKLASPFYSVNDEEVFVICEIIYRELYTH